MIPTRKTLILIILIAVVVFGLLVLALFGPKEVKISQEDKPIKVKSIIPENNSLIEPGKYEQFSVNFENEIDLSNLGIELGSYDVTSDKAFRQAEYKAEIKNKTLIITLKEATLPLNQYKIRVVNKLTGDEVYKASFSSGDIKPTPPLVNNTKLSSFLPYETESFSLTYSKERNLYVFNFKYNSESLESLESQYSRAKNEAIKFIESKEIDVKTVEIEWNFS